MCCRVKTEPNGVFCRGTLFYSNEIQQYTVPFMGSDPSVVKRTQRFLVEENQDTPVSVY